MSQTQTATRSGRKRRQAWSDAEHQRFLEAVDLYQRDWRRIEEYVGTKTAVQIRSHAQKHFIKLKKMGQEGAIPPPRRKRKTYIPLAQRLLSVGSGSSTEEIQSEDSQPPPAVTRSSKRRRTSAAPGGKGSRRSPNSSSYSASSDGESSDVEMSTNPDEDEPAAAASDRRLPLPELMPPPLLRYHSGNGSLDHGSHLVSGWGTSLRRLSEPSVSTAAAATLAPTGPHTPKRLRPPPHPNHPAATAGAGAGAAAAAAGVVPGLLKHFDLLRTIQQATRPRSNPSPGSRPEVYSWDSASSTPTRTGGGPLGLSPSSRGLVSPSSVFLLNGGCLTPSRAAGSGGSVGGSEGGGDGGDDGSLEPRLRLGHLPSQASAALEAGDGSAAESLPADNEAWQTPQRQTRTAAGLLLDGGGDSRRSSSSRSGLQVLMRAADSKAEEIDGELQPPSEVSSETPNPPDSRSPSGRPRPLNAALSSTAAAAEGPETQEPLLSPVPSQSLVLEWQTVNRSVLGSFSAEQRQSILSKLRQRLEVLRSKLAHATVRDEDVQRVHQFAEALLDPSAHNHVEELHLMPPDSKILFHQLMHSL